MDQQPRKRQVIEPQLSALQLDGVNSSARHQHALWALRLLPDRCAPSVGELARRIGADKLELIVWARTDLHFARLVAAKVA